MTIRSFEGFRLSSREALQRLAGGSRTWWADNLLLRTAIILTSRAYLPVPEAEANG
jgi:hypothetical protein